MSGAEQSKAHSFEAKTSSERQPYHYVGSGLPNVYLVGVEYRTDQHSDVQQADIPCLPGLLEAIAKALLEKRSLLTGDEIRFLRKRLKKPSKDFAGLVGVSSEQYSRIENGHAVTQTVDRVIRLLYVTLAKLNQEAAEGVVRVKWEAEMNHESVVWRPRTPTTAGLC